jgi:hypothetical protein
VTKPLHEIQAQGFPPFVTDSHLKDNVSYPIEEEQCPCFADQRVDLCTHILDSRTKENNDMATSVLYPNSYVQREEPIMCTKIVGRQVNSSH